MYVYDNIIQGECNELHSPITIIVIRRGKDTIHTVTKAVTPVKENELRYLLFRQTEMKNICNVGSILRVARKKKPAAFKDSIWKIFYCGSSSLAVMCLINFQSINI